MHGAQSAVFCERSGAGAAIAVIAVMSCAPNMTFARFVDLMNKVTRPRDHRHSHSRSGLDVACIWYALRFDVAGRHASSASRCKDIAAHGVGHIGRRHADLSRQTLPINHEDRSRSVNLYARGSSLRWARLAFTRKRPSTNDGGSAGKWRSPLLRGDVVAQEAANGLARRRRRTRR
jgi:hypothetical protein